MRDLKAMLDVLDDSPVGGVPFPPPAGEQPRSLTARIDSVAAIAARHAGEVDRDGRFPHEAFAAIRAERLLGIMVPQDLGGDGATIGATIDLCYRLGRACASAAMIYAMHQTKVACVVHHHAGDRWQQDLLRRLAATQLLFASSTTEGQGGGNVRSSVAPIVADGERITLDRAATVMSYGAEADAVVTTARRSPEAANSDQVLAVFLKEDYQLERSGGWDTLGMRGTCSAGFAMKAAGRPDQVLSVPYATIHAETMTPVAHLLWSGVWAGIAAAAVEKAQGFIRKAARQAAGQMPPGAPHLVKATSSLGVLRHLIADSARGYEQVLGQADRVRGLEFQTAITLLKVDASELAVATVMSALRACGLSGYRNDGEASIGRHLRDVLSSPVMINNDRILSSLSATALMTPIPLALTA